MSYEEDALKREQAEKATRPNWRAEINNTFEGEPQKLKDLLMEMAEKENIEYVNSGNVEKYIKHQRDSRINDFISSFGNLFEVLEEKMINEQERAGAENLRQIKEIGEREASLKKQFNEIMSNICESYDIPCPEDLHKAIYGKEQDGGKKKARKTKK